MFIENPYMKYAEQRNGIKNVLAHEKEFTIPEKIEKIENGCIFCNSELKGNNNLGYYCDECNIIFSDKNLLNADKKK